MGTAKVGLSQPVLFLSLGADWILAFLAWDVVAQMVPTSLIVLVPLCLVSIGFLFWLRLSLAKAAWLNVWVIASPWCLSSFCFLPGLSLSISLPFVLIIWILFGFWGKARFYPLFLGGEHLHRARFAEIDEISHLLVPTPVGDGLLLGSRPPRTLVSVRAHPTHRELGNLLISGPTRSGKGLLATSQLLSWEHSVIVNDIKGDLYSQTAGYRSGLGPVLRFDTTGKGHSYDPLAGKQTEDELLSAATHLLFKADEGDGLIFTQRAIVMLTQIFAAARLEGIPPLPYARYIIRSGLAAAAARLQHVSPDLATQFLDIEYTEANLSDRFLVSSWGTLSARIRPLLTENVVRCFAGSDFDAGNLMCSDKPVSVYLCWPERDLLSLLPLVRLLWGSLIDELITTYDRASGRGCRPVLLLIDEAGRTAIPSLADHATTVVGRGISLWIAIQSLSQLEAVYGRARAQILRDNMESQIYYRPTDLATAQYLEHRLGQVSKFAQSHTVREGAETSEGRSERAIPLLTAQEILQLKDEEIIGFHRHLPPFRMRRMDWRGHPLLSKRRQLKAPELPALPENAEIPQIGGKRQTLLLPAGYIDPDEYTK